LESAYGHKYRTQVIDPTTMDEGYTLYTCMRCGDSYQDNILPPVNVNIPVTGITLSASNVVVEEGVGKFIDATVLPENATNKLVKWTSSDYEVADIAWNGANRERGFILGRSEGTAIITASTVDGTITAQCMVTVEKAKFVSYAALTSKVFLHRLPENTQHVLIAAYDEGRMISIIPGTLGGNNVVPLAAQADEIKVFYLGDACQPVTEAYKIELSQT